MSPLGALFQRIQFKRMIARRSTRDVHAAGGWLDDERKDGRPESVLWVVVFMAANRSRVVVVVREHSLHIVDRNWLALFAEQRVESEDAGVRFN